jgi:hypothetical protein
MLPVLLARKHQVVAYVRIPAKISPEAVPKLDSIVVGSASNSAASRLRSSLITAMPPSMLLAWLLQRV